MALRPLVFMCMTLLLAATASAQDAALNGTVTDTTGAVLPGVTVTTLQIATGNTLVGITDERGTYRIPLRVGTHRVSLELQGFATVMRQFDALVGQTLTVDVQLTPSSVQESVTVTGEAPLIE